MENKIQCLECRSYQHYINHIHLKSCCDLSVRQYREEYPDAEMTSETYREKLGEIRKGRKLSDDHKKNLSKSLQGRNLSDECKNNMSKSRKGRNLSEEHCKNISIAGKKSYENGRIPPMKGKKHTEESKRKNRISRINEIKEKNGQIHPNFNIKACEIFDWFNKEFNLNGHHAINGGEVHIKQLGYFVDYFEPTLNLVIEWDEKKHHYDSNGSLSERDIKRQKEIEEYLGCKFIRIKGDV